MSATDIAAVTALRTHLWEAGFRPVPILNWDAKGPSPGKRPLGDNWRESALKDPPFCTTIPAVDFATNTGLLADGLRPIDIDIDDPAIAAAVRALAIARFGPAPTRTRQNSPRCLMLYAAAEGQPRKIAITGASHTAGNACKIEILGSGQQLVAFGRHATGADLEWTIPPGDVVRPNLPVITEADLMAFLAEAALVIDAEPPGYTNGPANGGDHTGQSDPQAEPLRIVAALAAIPNTAPPDWEAWNRIGMALWAATGGSAIGGEAFNEWSKRHPAYDADATEERWLHYRKSPPTHIGAGTLFHLAGGTFHPEPETPEPPPPIDDPGYFNSVAMATAASPGWRKPSTLGKKTRALLIDPLPSPLVPPPPPEEPPGEAWPDEPPEIPVINCRGGELPRMIRAAQAALVKAGVALYQRGMLVQPTESEYTAADGSVTHSASLVPVTAPALLKLMAQSGIWRKWDGRVNGGQGGYIVCDPPDKLVSIVLNNRGDWPFPVVRGVLTCPTMRPDGSLLTTPGYDPVSRYYLMFPKGLEIPPIPENPSKDDARKAFERLDRLLDGYPFVSKISRAVGHTMLMTQVLRCAMPVSPLLAVSAKAPGTGKSHLVDLASAISIGRPCPAMGTGKKDEETEKGINTMLIAGVPGFSIDNVSRDIDTPTLNMATERPVITIRLFGVLEAVEIENAVTIYMTGNNLAIIDEQGRRTMRCDMDAGQERPERREFEGDPIYAVRANRGQYIADILTIARAYHVSGERVAPFSIGSYSAWSHFVREPIIWLTGQDPADTMDEARKDDPATMRLHAMVEGWREEFGNSALTVAEAVVRAQVDGFLLTMREHFPSRGGAEVDTARFGYWLRKFVGRVANGKRFVKDEGNTHGSIRWIVEYV